MDEKEGKSIYINNKINVNSKIYKKIEMLVGASTGAEKIDSITPEKINNDSVKKSIIKQKTEKYEPNIVENPLIWKICDNLYISCEATNNRTESSVRKNNIGSLVNHFNKNYRDNYLVISLKRSGISRHFKRCIAYEDDRFNLKNVCDIVKAAKFWTDQNENNVLVIEMKNGKENVIMFLISCIFSYLNPQKTAESALTTIRSIISSQFYIKNIDSAIRYSKYYDQMFLFNSTTSSPAKMLNQIIITTIPTILGDEIFTPKMKLITNSNTIEISPEKCYLDKHYIIFSNINIEIVDDIVISLWFFQENKSYHILDLSINAFFYNQGLYRFTRSEIETSLPQENIYKFFDENFYIDIVLFENKEKTIKTPYLPDYDIISGINVISEHFIGDFDDESFEKYLELGYDQIVSKVSSQLKFDESECRRLHEIFLENKLKSVSRAQTVDKIDEDDLRISKNHQSYTFSDEEDKTLTKKTYLEGDEMEITDIPIIEQNINYKDSGRQTTSSLFTKRQILDIPINENRFSIKPLYLSQLRNIEGTVFSKFKDLKIKIDNEKFEKFFCENNEKSELKKQAENTERISINPRRLFLASLCLKHLEVKKITAENIKYYLNEIPETLDTQELLNIMKCVLTKEEKCTLENLDQCSLNQVEHAMLEISNIPEIEQITSMLLFENVFHEEIARIDKIILSSDEIFSLLLSSNEIGILMKMILDISNTINYVYGRKRKFVNGFKIDTICHILTYNGIENYSLVDFIVETMIKNDVNFDKLNLVHEYLEKAKKEDFDGLKDSINCIIFNYRESVASFNKIEIYEKTKLRRFLGFACSRIKDTVSRFKVLQEKIDNFKKRMGEEQKKPIESILEPLCEVLEKLRKSHNKIGLVQENS